MIKALIVKIHRTGRTLNCEIIRQDERLRDRDFSFHYNGLQIKSTMYPELKGDKFYIRGDNATRDNQPFTYEYPTVAIAEAYRLAWEDAAAALNAARFEIDKPSVKNPWYFMTYYVLKFTSDGKSTELYNTDGTVFNGLTINFDYSCETYKRMTPTEVIEFEKLIAESAKAKVRPKDNVWYQWNVSPCTAGVYYINVVDGKYYGYNKDGTPTDEKYLDGYNVNDTYYWTKCEKPRVVDIQEAKAPDGWYEWNATPGGGIWFISVVDSKRTGYRKDGSLYQETGLDGYNLNETHYWKRIEKPTVVKIRSREDASAEIDHLQKTVKEQAARIKELDSKINNPWSLRTLVADLLDKAGCNQTARSVRTNDRKAVVCTDLFDAAEAVIAKGTGPSEDELREAIASNLKPIDWFPDSILGIRENRDLTHTSAQINAGINKCYEKA